MTIPRPEMFKVWKDWAMAFVAQLEDPRSSFEPQFFLTPPSVRDMADQQIAVGPARLYYKDGSTIYVFNSASTIV